MGEVRNPLDYHLEHFLHILLYQHNSCMDVGLILQLLTFTGYIVDISLVPGFYLLGLFSFSCFDGPFPLAFLLSALADFSLLLTWVFTGMYYFFLSVFTHLKNIALLYLYCLCTFFFFSVLDTAILLYCCSAVSCCVILDLKR